jgi:tetratricopeptide (TPR) repeat protein
MKKYHGPLIVRIFNWMQRAIRGPNPNAVLTRKRRSTAARKGDNEIGVARAASVTGALFSILVSGALVILVLALIYGFVQEFRRNVVIVDPISVPTRLAERGITSTVVAQRLVDQVNVVRHETGAFTEAPGIIGREEQVDISLLGNALSMRSTVRYVRDVLGRPETHITGDIVVSENMAVLNLRSGGERLSSTAVAIGSNDDLDRLVQLGAENLLQLTSPSELFYYYYWTDQVRGEWRRASAVLDYIRDHRNGESFDGYWFSRGLQAELRHMPADAVADYDGAIALNPRPAYFIRKAASLVDLGNDVDALAALALVTSRPSITANEWQMAGQVYQSLFRYEDALRAAGRCMALDRSNPWGFIEAAEALIGLHRYDAAVKVVRRAPIEHPLEQAYVHFEIAVALARMGATDEALRQSAAMLAQDPASELSLYANAEALFAAGRPAEAANFYAAASAKEPQATYICGEARARIAADEHQKGESLILAGKQRRRGEVLCWLAAGEQYSKAARDDLAIVEFQEAARLDPNDPIIFRRWAGSLTALGRLGEASEKQAFASASEKRNRDWKFE